jgi:hypothetical protein
MIDQNNCIKKTYDNYENFTYLKIKKVYFVDDKYSFNLFFLT